ncbi:FtsX-like permease family protein [Paracoccus versutus]|uniref:FtsX-like permease family protein n=1 Tax=Paracoccus versutus TaxID=34007 RepID=UPI000DF72E7E|nr:FtsX-like permease family protein [Paracoccus versutus]RDD73422.1 ABC transporter permease [Paracoccus versutus]
MIRFVLADLKRLWAGSVVIVLLVALAVALGVGVSLQERALRLGSARAAEKFDVIVGAPGSETQLVLSAVFLQPAALPLMPGEVLAELNDDPRVEWAAPVGFGDFHAGYPIVGTTTTLIEGTAGGFSQGGMFRTEGEAVVGSAVPLQPGEAVVPTHGQVEQGGHEHEGIRYRVSGRLNPTGTPWDRAILVPIQAVWHVHGMGLEPDQDHDHDHAGPDAAHEDEETHEHHDMDADAPLDEDWHRGALPGLPAILVKPRTIADAYRLRQDYRADGRTLAVFPGEILTGLYATLGDARQVLAVIAAGTQLLVAAALLMVTVIHVGQRRRQIGALRAFGAPRAAVFGIVWLELSVLVGLGILLGYGGGYLAASLLSRAFAMQRGFSLPVGFTSEDGAMLAILVAVAALLAALPAWLAYRQSPAAALRN